MLILNIFTILFGCLLAAISPDTWEQLIGKSKRAPLLSALLIAISTLAFISFWSAVGSMIFNLSTIKQPNWFGYALFINLVLLLFLGIAWAIIRFLAKVLGQKSIDPQWQLTFSKGSLMGVMIFGFTSELLMIDTKLIDILPQIFLITSTLGLLLTLGACIWLLFIIGLTNSGPSRADKNYYTKMIRTAKTIIGIAALFFLAIHVSDAHQAMLSSIATSTKGHHFTAADLI